MNQNNLSITLLESSAYDYSFYCKNLTTNKIATYREGAAVETASVIKLSILLCLLNKVQSGEVSLQKPMTILKRQIGRNGSGSIQHFDLSKPIVLFNLALLMMSESDNVATNVIIELLGKDTINKYIKDTLQMPETKLETSLLDFPDDLSPANTNIGTTTAMETAVLVEKLLNHEVLNEAFTKITMNMMRQARVDFFCRRLPLETLDTWGNKTGSLAYDHYPDIIVNDCGYILAKDGTRYAFAMFMHGKTNDSTHAVDAQYKLDYADLAQAIFTELSKK